MRAVLLDWLFEVMVEYRLSHKTLQLAANYLDRYLSLVPTVSKSCLQLVGSAALFIASKFEDLRPIELNALVWISDEAYSATQVMKTEEKMLEVLKWDLAAVPCVTFVEHLVHEMALEHHSHLHMTHLTHFLSHLCVQSWSTSHETLPSQQAACVVYYAGAMLGLFKQWPSELLSVPPLCVLRDHPVVDRVLKALHTLYKGLHQQDLHRALRSKYSHFSLMQVALTPPLKNFSL